MQKAQAVGRVLWRMTNRHHAVRGGVAAAKTVGKATARATRILWLEITGFFFAVFSLYVLGATWNQWQKIQAGDASSPPTWHVGVAIIFIYFAVSSCSRAQRVGSSVHNANG